MRNDQRPRRHLYAAGVCSLAALAVAVASLGRLSPLVLYNRTPSVPVGWYALAVGRTPHRGELVAFMLPPAAWDYARRRGERRPNHVRLLKPVLAVAGDHVTTTGGVLCVDGVAVGTLTSKDDAGRPLPRWRGDRVLTRGELFVGSSEPRSFDGRYFGPIQAVDVIGVYRPVRTSAGTSGGE